MAALDRVKEQLAYLKFWLATGGLLLLTLVIMYLHRRIEGEIKVVGTL